MTFNAGKFNVVIIIIIIIFVYYLFLRQYIPLRQSPPKTRNNSLSILIIDMSRCTWQLSFRWRVTTGRLTRVII